MFASALGWFVAAIITFLIIFVIVIANVVSYVKDADTELVPNSVLHIRLDKPIPERTVKTPLDNFNISGFDENKTIGLNDILLNIKKAKNDTNINGIYLDVSFIPSSYSVINEVRNALIDFKESGKFIYSYSEIYIQKSYYLASVADSVFINPKGYTMFNGLGAELFFIKGALDKLEIEAQVFRPTNNKFKSAVEPVITDKISDANRAQTAKLLSSMWNFIINDISISRNISADSLNSIADSLYAASAFDAYNCGLVDKLIYKDDLLEKLRVTSETNEDSPVLISLNNYANINSTEKALENTEDNRESIAIIYANGAIYGGDSQDVDEINSESLSKEIRKVRKDENVKAIVLRVNSPGGSALASDVIWRELNLAKQEMPVVASLSSVAASGGYYIACNTDTIVSNPLTVTGSIGVFAYLFNGKKLLNNLGITSDTVTTNSYTRVGGFSKALNSKEKYIIQKSVDTIYADFLSRVSQGRNLSVSYVDSIAQGRIWSGLDAKEIGLVDVFGGIDDAVVIAANMANVSDYKIEHFPNFEKSFLSSLRNYESSIVLLLDDSHLKPHYKYLEYLNDVLGMQGVQARNIYNIDIY